MNCDRCCASDRVLRDIWTPDGWKLAICADCRSAIEGGAGFKIAKPSAPPRLSRMAKTLRRIDETDPNAPATTNWNQEKYTIAAQQPLPASWRKK